MVRGFNKGVHFNKITESFNYYGLNNNKIKLARIVPKEEENIIEVTIEKKDKQHLVAILNNLGARLIEHEWNPSMGPSIESFDYGKKMDYLQTQVEQLKNALDIDIIEKQTKLFFEKKIIPNYFRKMSDLQSKEKKNKNKTVPNVL